MCVVRGAVWMSSRIFIEEMYEYGCIVHVQASGQFHHLIALR